jgi:hypothetical protein
MSDTNPAQKHEEAYAPTPAILPVTQQTQRVPTRQPSNQTEAIRLAIKKTTHERDTHYASQLRTLRTRLAVTEHESSIHSKREFERGFKQGFKNGEEHAKAVGKKTWLKEAYQKGYRDG